MHGQQKGATSSCPFDPTPGGLPPYLAGREREQRSIARYLHQLEHREHAPFLTVVFGPRGNGKTALLEWAKCLAVEKGVQAISVAPSMIDSEDALIRALSAGSWWSSILKPMMAFGLHDRTNGERATTIEKAFGKRIRRRPLLLLIDEAQTLDLGVGQRLMQSAQEVAREGAGMLLMLVGTPDLPSQLRKMHVTFWERSPVLPITRLDASASADAVRIPLEAANRPISEEALEQIVQECNGYPIFLQLWGRALWHRAEAAGRAIGIDDVNRARPAFEEARDSFYGLRYAELRNEHLVAPAAALSSVFGNREELGESEVVAVLKTVLVDENLPSSPEDIMNLLARLHDLGYIWSPGGNLIDRYFSGIPSLMTFVARKASN